MVPAFGLWITDSGQFAPRDKALDDALRVDGTHGANSNNSEFYRLHNEIRIAYPLTPPLHWNSDNQSEEDRLDPKGDWGFASGPDALGSGETISRFLFGYGGLFPRT